MFAHCDCHITFEACIARAIDLAHAAGAERRQDLVRAEACASGEGHAATLILAAEPLMTKDKGRPENAMPRIDDGALDLCYKAQLVLSSIGRHLPAALGREVKHEDLTAPWPLAISPQPLSRRVSYLCPPVADRVADAGRLNAMYSPE